jgi:hypothetical protein
MADIDAGIKDRDMHARPSLGMGANENLAALALRFLHAAGLQGAPTLLHKLPPLFHLRDPFDGQANDFSVSFHTQDLLGLTEGAVIHKKGPPFQVVSRSHTILRELLLEAYIIKKRGILIN